MAASAVTMLESNENEEKTKHPVKVDKNLLDIFWSLSKTKKPNRLQAAASVLQILFNKQKSLEEENQYELKSPELEYAIQRLVRGLASSREASRQGYCLVLTQILKYFLTVSVEDVVGYVEKDLSYHNKLEKCQIVIGRVLAYCAIVRSERLVGDPYISFIVTNLFDISIGKPYIQQVVYKLMLELYSQVNIETFKNNLWPHLKKKLSCGWEKCTPDILWFLLLSLRIFPDAVSIKFLRKHWDNEDLFSAENMSHWQRILKQSTTVHPQMHPVCMEFLIITIQKKNLQNYWNILIDETLFENDQNEKAFLGLMMLKETLKQTKKKRIVKAIFSPKLNAALSKNLLNKNHNLHTFANELITYFGHYIKDCDDSQIQASILKTLLLQPRAALMENVLRNKAVSLMISLVPEKTIYVFYEILQSIAFNRNNSSLEAKDDRKPHVAVFQIGLLVSHPSVFTNVEWRMNVLKLLFIHAFYIVKEPIENLPKCDAPTDWMPKTLKTAFCHSFMRALDSLSRRTNSEMPVLKHQLQYLTDIVDFAESLFEKADSALEPVFALEKVKASWQLMKTVVKKLQKNEKKEKVNDNGAFQILFLQLGLQLFQEGESISDLLEELEVCYKNSKKKNSDGEHPWIQVIVDILLSLLSQPSHHMRCIVGSVFPLICPFMTKESLQLILDVFNSEKSKSLEDEDEEEDDNMEFESGDSSSSSEDEEQLNENSKDEEFKLKLQKVLGTDEVTSDTESVVLSDTEMFKLDETLSEVFRSRKKVGHTQLTSDQKSFLTFQTRCLDLIPIYLKEESPMSVIIHMIRPIFALYNSTRQKRQQIQLSIKSLTILKNIAKIRKFQNCDDVSLEDIEAILEELIIKCHIESDISVAGNLHLLCHFLVFCEQKLKSSDKSFTDEVSKVEHFVTLKKFWTALDDFVKKNNSRMVPDMFVSLMNAYPEYAWSFLASLEKYAFDETSVRLYRKTQCLGLISAALKVSKNNNTITKELWIATVSSLKSKAIEGLKSALTANQFKPCYVTELICLLTFVIRVLKDNQVHTSEPELVKLISKMTSEQCRKLMKNGKNLRRQLITLLGGDLQQIKIEKSQVTNQLSNEVLDSSIKNADEVPVLKKRKKQNKDSQVNKKLKSSKNNKRKSQMQDNNVVMNGSDREG